MDENYYRLLYFNELHARRAAEHELRRTKLELQSTEHWLYVVGIIMLTLAYGFIRAVNG